MMLGGEYGEFVLDSSKLPGDVHSTWSIPETWSTVNGTGDDLHFTTLFARPETSTNDIDTLYVRETVCGVVNEQNQECAISGTNYTIIADVTYSDGCKARLQYGNPLSNISDIVLNNVRPQQRISAKVKSQQQKMILYPNPVSDKLSIYIENSENKIAELYIVNVQGQTVMSSLDFILGSELNVSYLSQGIYIIYLRQGNQRYLDQFIKQ